MDLRAICSLLGFTIAESQKNIIDVFTCNLWLIKFYNSLEVARQ